MAKKGINKDKFKGTEIDGIFWHPDAIKENYKTVDVFIKAHISIIPFKNLDKKVATEKLTAIYKKFT